MSKKRAGMADLQARDSEGEMNQDQAQVEDQTPETLYDREIYVKEPQEIVESKVQTFKSHLFKLHEEHVIKNTGVTSSDYENEPDKFHSLLHGHFFRTRDSEGKATLATKKLSTNPKAVTFRSTSLGGHFHLIEMIENPVEGKPPIIIAISPPMVLTKKKVKGKWITVEEPANDYDHHKHKVEYINTLDVKQRSKNLEAAKVIAIEGVKGQAPKGVTSL